MVDLTQLRLALVDGFTPEEFPLLFFDVFGKPLHIKVNLNQPYPNVVADAVMWIKSEGEPAISDIVAAATLEKPRNMRLRELAENAGLAADRNGLESIFAAGAALVGVEEFRKRMAMAERSVARVEYSGQAVGTGFLVSDRILITNYHVVHPPNQGAAWHLSRFKFTFDFKDIGSKPTTSRTYELDLENPILAESPISELDFCCLNIKGDPGLAPPAGLENAPARGYLVPSPAQLTANQQIAVIQHPQGESMKFGCGSITSVRDRRIFHNASTLPGSSGSPCFALDWTLIALHQHGKEYGEGLWNGGIPFSDICLDPKYKLLLGGQ